MPSHPTDPFESVPALRPEAAQLVARLPDDVERLILSLRKLVIRAAPTAVETVVWNSLSYHLPEQGGRVKGAVCQLTPRPDGVDVGFIHGVLLADPRRLLHGTGKSKRHVPLSTGQELPSRALHQLVRAAVLTRPGESV